MAHGLPLPLPMGTKNEGTKSDASRISHATRARRLFAANAGAKFSEVAGNVVGAGRKVQMLGKASRHRLQETVRRVTHFSDHIATRISHSARETAQKVIHSVDEVKLSAEHRCLELLEKLDQKLAANSKATSSKVD